MGIHIVAFSILNGLWLVTTSVFTVFAHRWFKVEKKNRGLVRLCIILAGITTWMFWVITYLAQMNPLIGPKLKKVFILQIAKQWVSHKNWKRNHTRLKSSDTYVLMTWANFSGLPFEISHSFDSQLSLKPTIPSPPPNSSLKLLMAISVLPFALISVFWAVVGIVVPIFIPKKPNRGVIQLCLVLTAVTCWLFWVCTYLAQMNPLIGPKLKGEVLLNVAREWGNPIPDLDSNATAAGH